MTIRLLALDLDDTLLNSRLQITPKSVDALNQVVDRGIKVTLATGRMFRSARPFARQLGIEVPLITYQGALVKNAVSEEVLYHRPVPAALAAQAVEYVKETGYHYQVYFNDHLYMERLTPEGSAYARLAGVDPVIEPDLAQRLMVEEKNIRSPPPAAAVGRPTPTTLLWTALHNPFQIPLPGNHEQGSHQRPGPAGGQSVFFH